MSILVLAVLLPAAGLAQDKFPDVPKNHWVFETMAKMKKDGLLVGYPEGLSSHPQSPGRYVLAVMTHACFTELRLLGQELQKTAKAPGVMAKGPEADKAYKDAGDDARRLRAIASRDEPSLAKLIKEFKPELDKLGADGDKVSRELSEVCNEIRHTQVSKPASAVASDSFLDVPDNHWVFEAMLRLTKDGLMVGYPVGFVGRDGQRASRYEFAVCSYACFSNLKSVTSHLVKWTRAPGLVAAGPAADKSYRDTRDQLQILKNDIATCEPLLDKLFKEFTPELKTLGVDTASLPKDLAAVCSEVRGCQVSAPGSALGQFRDVPTGHWAAQAVLDLRRLGIVQGYPNDDRFSGS